MRFLFNLLSAYMPLKLGKPKPFAKTELKRLLALFKKENLEKGEAAENIVYKYLKTHYPVVADFRFPKALTDWLTMASKTLNDFEGLHWIKRLQGTKFDFIVKDSNGKVFFVDAKSPKPEWLQWSCGATKEQYENYFRLSRVLPFYIYTWISEEKGLYIHKVRNPEKPKMEIKTNRVGDQAYWIPMKEIHPISKAEIINTI
jgi:hypothetical protein